MALENMERIWWSAPLSRVYLMQSADHFAKGSLKSCPISIDQLTFGTERSHRLPIFIPSEKRSLKMELSCKVFQKIYLIKTQKCEETFAGWSSRKSPNHILGPGLCQRACEEDCAQSPSKRQGAGAIIQKKKWPASRH